MDLPRPGPEHRKLGWLAGRWEGDEQLSPSPWDPEGGRAVGHYEWRPALDGFYLLGDYRQERDGAVNFRGHAVIGWDGTAARYVMYCFDSTGIVPSTSSRGEWDDDTLRLALADNNGHHRYSWTLRGDELVMTIENSPDGESWTTFLEGTYHRA